MDELLDDKAKDWATKWLIKLDNNKYYRPSRFTYNIIARSLIRGYKAGYRAAKRENKTSKNKKL
jgi:hypothetical protein